MELDFSRFSMSLRKQNQELEIARAKAKMVHVEAPVGSTQGPPLQTAGTMAYHRPQSISHLSAKSQTTSVMSHISARSQQIINELG